MTTIGEAFIEVHADTKPFDRELDRDLERASQRAEKGLDRAGQDFGDKVSDSMARRIGQRGRDFGRAVENATRNVVVRVRSTIRFDRIGASIRQFFRRDVGDGISEEIGVALDRASRRGGPIDKLGDAVADAVGAGFNISGRSPLIAVLIPAILAIGGVIVAALQAVNALVAVLFIIPGLLASIALQVGVVAIAFQGVGTAIQGAFAAKNAKELREALKGLTPSARDFVRELLPLRDLFRDIGKTVQEKFFAQLTGVITALRRALGPSLIKGFGEVAEAAGGFFRSFGMLLASPGFVKFFNVLIPATVKWINGFGKSLFGDRGLVTGMIAMATALMPFMDRFGSIMLTVFQHLGDLMFRLAENPGTTTWLDSMAETLEEVFDLLFELGQFLLVFFSQLDKAGGREVIELLAAALNELTNFLASPLGLKAMEGIIDLAKIGIASFVGLLIAILAVIAIFEALAEALNSGFLPAIKEAIRIFIQGVIDAATFLGVWISRIIGWIGSFFKWLWNQITTTKNNFSSLTSGVASMASSLFARLKAIPAQVAAVFKNFGTLLINSGRALIQGLIDGVRQKIDQLRSLLGSITGMIGGFFGNSPAIYGPLRGQGWTTYRGRNIMHGLIRGIRGEVPLLRRVTTMAANNIQFAPKSIQVNFQGALPTETQARTVGAAVGNGAANMIAARNTRLAVRML